MANITATCKKCNRQFFVIEQEQKFLKDKDLPLPINCPACRQERRLKLRGGRQLFKTKCQKCDKEIITSFDPQKTKRLILCKEDYEQWFEENDPIIKEPLPEL